MKWFFVLLVLLTGLLPSFSPCRAADDSSLVSPVIRSVQTAFVQEKHLKILTKPLVSTGRLFFQAPGSLRWEYATPVPSILLVHGGVTRRFVQRDGKMVEEINQGMDAMQMVLGEISGWLEGHFTDTAMFAVIRQDSRTVLLRPRQPGVAALIQGVELQLADHQGLLDRVTILEGQDSRTVLRFNDRTLNGDIAHNLFTAP